MSIMPVASQSPVPAVTPTNYAHPRCYAQCLNDCSTKISREHYVSKVILENMFQSGGVLVSGMPWMQNGERRALSPNSLVANILCERHNNLLSGLDSMAGDFFDELDRINMEMFGATESNICTVKDFNGLDLEHWMLKLLLGTVNADVCRTMSGTPIQWQTMESWIKVLFGYDTFAQGCGLYMFPIEGRQIRMEKGITASPQVSDGTYTITSGDIGEVYGLSLTINGIPFLCNLAAPPSGYTVVPFPNGVYRPQGISIEQNTLVRTVRFAWFDNRKHAPVTTRWVSANTNSIGE